MSVRSVSFGQTLHKISIWLSWGSGALVLLLLPIKMTMISKVHLVRWTRPCLPSLVFPFSPCVWSTHSSHLHSSPLSMSSNAFFNRFQRTTHLTHTHNECTMCTSGSVPMQNVPLVQQQRQLGALCLSLFVTHSIIITRRLCCCCCCWANNYFINVTFLLSMLSSSSFSSLCSVASAD